MLNDILGVLIRDKKTHKLSNEFIGSCIETMFNFFTMGFSPAEITF